MSGIRASITLEHDCCTAASWESLRWAIDRAVNSSAPGEDGESDITELVRVYFFVLCMIDICWLFGVADWDWTDKELLHEALTQGMFYSSTPQQ